MNSQSTSSNCSELGAAERCGRPPDGRTKRLQRRSSASSHRPRHVVVAARPQAQQWELVQEIFLASRPRFVRLAYAVLRTREDAEDAVQDAMLLAYRHLRSFEGRSAFTTWFTRIVLNAALMIRRKRKRFPAEFPEPHSVEETTWVERISDSQLDPEMAYAQEETLRWVDVLLGQMSPGLRQAFTMTYCEEISSKDAGALLGISTGTFKSRLFRARRHLVEEAHRFTTRERIPSLSWRSHD
jgi:RNA polymerase sigma-70 factor, ECF subfamily